MSRPRVTAQHSVEPIDKVAWSGPFAHTTPGVEVSVSFDLHDHEAALKALERAVADVRAQIEETRGDVIEEGQ